MKVPGSKIVPCQGVLGSNHSLTFGLITQVSGLGPLGPLVLGSDKPRNAKMLFFLLKNANNCWHFNIYEQEKFHAQLS